jgi:hypothetical protein
METYLKESTYYQQGQKLGRKFNVWRGGGALSGRVLA